MPEYHPSGPQKGLSMSTTFARLFGLLVIVIVGATAGCASVINGTTQEVGFRSVPTGATVAVSGQTATTPTKLTLNRNQEHTITFTKEGHRERQATLKQKLDGAFYGNLALGGIVGMAVDMGNGSAYQLSPGNVEMDMMTGLVREFDRDEPIRTVETPPPSSLAEQAAPAVTVMVVPPPREPAVPVRDTGLRYIAPNKGGGGFVLWTSLVSFNNCVQATTRGTEQSRRLYCEDGPPGVKPRVGDVDAGTEVELLDAKDCGNDMAYVRVLAGPHKGETGCLAPIGLTRIKTEGFYPGAQPAAAPAPSMVAQPCPQGSVRTGNLCDKPARLESPSTSAAPNGDSSSHISPRLAEACRERGAPWRWDGRACVR